MTKATNDVIDPVDIALGAKIRAFREQAGITQSQLAAGSGVTFQQIQKYERGVNRVAVARLCRIAGALNRHPAEFLPPLNDAALDDGETPDRTFVEFAKTPGALDVARVFVGVMPKERAVLTAVAKAFAT